MTESKYYNQMQIQNPLCEEQYSDEYYQAQTQYQQENQPKYQTNQQPIQGQQDEQYQKQNIFGNQYQTIEYGNIIHCQKTQKNKRDCKAKCFHCLKGCLRSCGKCCEKFCRCLIITICLIIISIIYVIDFFEEINKTDD